MAYYGLLPGQKIIGGYAPPGAGGLRDGNIIVIEIANAPKVRGTPRLAFFTYQGQSAGGVGYPDAEPPASDANIVVDWDPITKKFIYTKVTLPNTVLVDIYTVRNNVENNKKYGGLGFNNFAYVNGKYEYVPGIKEEYVAIIKALYGNNIDGNTPGRMTPEVIAIVNEMLDEIQKGSERMVGVDVAFNLFYGIRNWTEFARNAKDIDSSSVAEWINVLLGNSNYDVVVKNAAYRYRTALQVELNRS